MERKIQNEYEYVNELIRVTKSIKNLYNKLYYLETIGKKDSLEYQKNLGYLETSKEVEDELYRRCPDYRKCFDLIEAYMDGTREDDIKRMLGIYDETDDKLVKERIQEELFKRMTFSDELVAMVKNSLSSEYLTENVADVIKETINLFDIIEQDYRKAFLYYLREELEKDENLSIHKSLLGVKYNMLFSSRTLEDFLLEEKFNLPNDIYFNAEIMAEIYGFETFRLEAMKNRYIVDIVIKTILELLEINDDSYDNKNQDVYALVLKCFLRSGLLFITDDDYQNILHGFIDYMNEAYQYNSINSFDRSENIIIDALNAYKEERKRFVKVKRNN